MKDLIQMEEKECQCKTSEVTWMAEMEVVLRTAFQEEINQEEVTLETELKDILSCWTNGCQHRS